MGFAPAKAYQKARFDAGIPLTLLAVDELEKKCRKLKDLGVVFRKSATKSGRLTAAVFEDTCGNLIELTQ